VRCPQSSGGCGPAGEAADLQAKLRTLIDPVEDQVRLYPLDERSARSVIVVGARTIEDRQDFWIVM
jgi:CRISPR-associated protein Cas2